jgi:protein-disulfide isomerase
VVKKKGAAKPASRFYAILGIIAIAGVGLISFAALRPKNDVTTVDTSVGPAQAQGYVLGNPNAPVQVTEFADFECPACSQFATVTEPDVRKRLIDQGTVSLRFYDFPLPQHRNSLAASNAAACAADQNKFWEMHDMLFQTQDQWNGEATSRPKGVFKDLVKNLGMDVGKWEDCFDKRPHMGRIQANRREGELRKVGQTPTFVIGDQMLPGAIAYDKLKAYVDTALAKAPVAAAAKPDSASRAAGTVPDSAKKAAK